MAEAFFRKGFHSDFWFPGRIPVGDLVVDDESPDAAGILGFFLPNAAGGRDLSGRMDFAPANVGSTMSQAGPAGSFNGTSSAITGPNGSPWNCSNITVIIGVQPAALATFNCAIGRWDESATARIWGVFLTDTAGSLRWDTSPDGNFNSGNTLSVANVLAIGRRNVLGFTHNATTKLSAFYVDGIQKATLIANTGGLFNTNSAAPTIGHSPVFAGAAQWWNGAVDFAVALSRDLNPLDMFRRMLDPFSLLRPRAPMTFDAGNAPVPPPFGTPFLPKRYPIRYVRRRVGHRYY